jgi:amidohydrolase
MDYASTIDGKMHACGHDSHTAMALGAAQLFTKEKFDGQIRFLFQPSEEAADEEGKSGAQRMVEDGAMNGVDYVIAQHVDPTHPVGTITISPGPCSGGVDSALFQKIVAGSALDAGVDAQIVRHLSQASDHPISLHFPEGDYLKGLVCVKV